MKVKLVYDYDIFSWQRYGGISRYFVELATHVNESNIFNVEIYCFSHVNNYLKGSIFESGRFIRLPKKTEFINTYLNYLSSSIYLKHQRPDILHETYYSCKTSAPKGCPKVVTVHDMIHEKFPGSFSKYDRTSIKKRIAIERADHIICVSENTRNDLIEHLNIDERKISTIYHGHRLKGSLLAAPPVEVGARPFLLYVGERGGYKNFQNLLLAYACSDFLNREFDLIAFGGGGFSPHELTEFKGLGLRPDAVRQLTGSDDALANLYRLAAAFVYPSLYEGFGIPPLEAMGFDCPVVCSHVSSIPEVVGNAGHYFSPADVESIRDAIESVVTKDDLRKQLVLNGRERTSFFSWDRCAEETMEVYKGLC